MLTKGNYPKWRMHVKGHLSTGDHGCVIKHTADPQGNLVDPVPPTDPDELWAWQKSEWVVWGVLLLTANKLHFELLEQYEDQSAWKIWQAIEEHHVQDDVSLRHEAWMQLFSIRKKEGESYIDLYHQVKTANAKINQVTP